MGFGCSSIDVWAASKKYLCFRIVDVIPKPPNFFGSAASCSR